MRVLYHDDMDGRCAAFWAMRKYDLGDEDLLPHNYGWHLEPASFEDEVVLVLDLTLESNLVEICDYAEHVVWIDHHATSVRYSQEAELELPGIISSKQAACVLTYLYLYVLGGPHAERVPTDSYPPPCGDFISNLESQVPEFTRLVGDRDIWRWKYGPRSRYFHAGMLARDTNPCSRTWIDTAAGVEGIVQDGRLIEEYRRREHEQYVQAYGFEVELEGNICFACNRGKASSHLFDSVGEYDIYITFVYDGEKYSVSLYSEDVDVARIAEKHGGGGHRGAAGFQCEKLPFRRVL